MFNVIQCVIVKQTAVLLLGQRFICVTTHSVFCFHTVAVGNTFSSVSNVHPVILTVYSNGTLVLYQMLIAQVITAFFIFLNMASHEC